jgi:hypothetical protein
MQCPVCRALYLADPGHTCTVCHVGLVQVPTRRRRTGSETVPLAPEVVREEVTARLRAIAEEDKARNVDRVTFTWPDEPVDDKEDTQV